MFPQLLYRQWGEHLSFLVSVPLTALQTIGGTPAMPLPLALFACSSLLGLILVPLRLHFGSFWATFWGPKPLQTAIPLGFLKLLLLKRLWDWIWLIFGCPWGSHFETMLVKFGYGKASALQCKFGYIFGTVWAPFLDAFWKVLGTIFELNWASRP